MPTAQTLFALHESEHVRLDTLSALSPHNTRASVARTCYKLGRSIFDAQRPDHRGVGPARVTPAVQIALPAQWLTWPDNIGWSPSACARWCVVAGLELHEWAAAHGVIPRGTAIPSPRHLPGVRVESTRLWYPKAFERSPAKMERIGEIARDAGMVIDWCNSVVTSTTVGVLLVPLEP